jgi:myo-inositol-1(or 4)-monophosphatase
MNKNALRHIEQHLLVFTKQAGEMAVAMQAELKFISAKKNKEVDASTIVTGADREIGAFAERYFQEHFPGCVAIQEETVEKMDTSKITDDTVVFIIDPIDGTLFYAQQSFAWSVSTGCFCGWKPVAGCVFAPQIQHIYYTGEDKSYLNGGVINSFFSEDAMKRSLLLRHVKAYHSIDGFPGYTGACGSVALHLAMVAAGFACGCVTSRHRLYDVAGAAMILENAGAELRLLNGEIPDWKHLILNPAERAPDFFFACPKGAFELLTRYVKRNPDIGY